MDVEGVGEGVGVTVSCRDGDLGTHRLHAAAAPASIDINWCQGDCSNVRGLHFISAGLLHVQAPAAMM